MFAFLLPLVDGSAAGSAADHAALGPVRLIVRLGPDQTSNPTTLFAEQNARSFAPLAGLDGAYTLDFDSRFDALRSLAQLEHHPATQWVERDSVTRFSFEPNDPLFEQQVWAQAVDLSVAWDITTGRDSVVVAVVDSGVSADHPDLQGKLLPGYDFVDNDAIPEDSLGHGTAVAGIIGARGDDGIGVAGVAMDTMILPVRVGTEDGAPVSAIAAGIIWAVDQGADVINLSLVLDHPSETLREALGYAYERNVPVVAPAGNEPDTVAYPAAYEQSFSIGASTVWGSPASFTSQANRVDLIAPGSSILAPWWTPEEGDTWKSVSGTSYAAAMVSGALALLKSIDAGLTPEELRELIHNTALQAGPERPMAGAGAGQLDVGGALTALLERSFERTWTPVDQPVANGLVDRSWMWGPSEITAGFETYVGSPGGERFVRYYDKGRMEIRDPLGSLDDPWYVTTGRLAYELITGQVQVGDDNYLFRGPASIPVAGDATDPLAPSYADLRAVLDAPALEQGETVTQMINGFGQVGVNERYAEYGVTASAFIPETGHRIASVFWNYLNGSGLVLHEGQLVDGRLFDPPFFAVGLPITEAYWSTVRVDGERHDVLIQCFERRCLTYTPDNVPQWQVEMGNVGQHYYAWRYGADGRSLPPRSRAS